MDRHDLSQPETKKGFPTGLVILGLLLAVFIWLRVYRPEFLGPGHLPVASAPATPATAQVANLQTAVTPHATPPATHPMPAAAAAEEPADDPPTEDLTDDPPTEDSADDAATEDPQEKKGNFYRFTDEQGVIHLVDDPLNIPPCFRKQAKVYRDTTPVTRVRIVNNQVLVPVTLRNGRRTVEATMVLDTGCSVTIISEELAARLEIDPDHTRPGLARVADGRGVAARIGLIDRITVGPGSKTFLEVGIMSNPGPADGLLGINFLRDFRYRMDFGRQQIDWR